MNIKHYSSESLNLGMEELVFYLSQIILSKTDKMIKEKHDKFIESKDRLKKSKDKLRESRSKLLHVIQEYERIQTLHEVVKLIDTLRKEGALLGNDRMKMLNLLGKVKEKDTSSLKSLKNNLTVNIPVSSGRTLIS